MFPFSYNGVTYTGCTKVDNDVPWCATSYLPDGTNANDWANCGPGCPITKECLTSVGNSNGGKCLFPFSYNGVTYTGCTKVDNDVPWCATSYLPDGTNANDWANCGPGCPITKECLTSVGNSNGGKCLFPFSYNGVTYTGCTKVDHDRPWCATSYHPGSTNSNYWDNCGPGCPMQGNFF